MKKIVVSKNYAFLLVLVLLSLAACKKEDDMMTPDTDPPMEGGGIRYVDQVFTDLKESIEVSYGVATTQGGKNVNLTMNIYEPANDSETRRPLIVLAHGGGFAEGDKTDLTELAQSFAKSGYVATTIGYRLLDSDDGTLSFAVLDAVHDMKAAVRFFTKDNAYNIDVDNIFVGGFSAGAVMGLHYAYISESEVTSLGDEMANYLEANGGLSGNSGNPGASEKVKGVINIAGGLLRADLVSDGEPILYSVHGDGDVSVYCAQDPDQATNPNGDFLEGSCLIHPAADAAGIVNTFKRIPTGGHGAFFTCAECEGEIRMFIHANL